MAGTAGRPTFDNVTAEGWGFPLTITLNIQTTVSATTLEKTIIPLKFAKPRAKQYELVVVAAEVYVSVAGDRAVRSTYVVKELDPSGNVIQTIATLTPLTANYIQSTVDRIKIRAGNTIGVYPTDPSGANSVDASGARITLYCEAFGVNH